MLLHYRGLEIEAEGFWIRLVMRLIMLLFSMREHSKRRDGGSERKERGKGYVELEPC